MASHHLGIGCTTGTKTCPRGANRLVSRQTISNHVDTRLSEYFEKHGVEKEYGAMRRGGTEFSLGGRGRISEEVACELRAER